MKITNLGPDKLIFFGDDKADAILSLEANIDCILLNRSSNPRFAGIHSFDEIEHL